MRAPAIGKLALIPNKLQIALDSAVIETIWLHFCASHQGSAKRAYLKAAFQKNAIINVDYSYLKCAI